MKLILLGSFLAMMSLSAFACEDGGGPIQGYVCEYQCQPGGPWAKTKLSCDGFWVDPNPHYNQEVAACGGEPQEENCYTVR